jgi:ATP-dependent Clp protease adaptor protein ClpS
MSPGRPGAEFPGTAFITKTKPQTKRSSLYRVLLLNDDYTPMEFVVTVLGGSSTRTMRRRSES